MTLRVQAVGDVAPRRRDPASIFAGTAAALGTGDLLFGQMECPLSARGTPAPNAKLAMRTDPAVAATLRATGFDVMSIAGNHAMDFGAVALADTVEALEGAGIRSCGAGATIAQARRPAMLEASGRRVAVLAYCSILPAGYAAEAARAGCAPIRAYTHFHHVEPDQPGTPPRVLTFADRGDLDAMIADIRAAREQADVVLVSMHWGIHFVRATLADYQAEVAHAAIDAGAHAIIGHHPHLLKGIELYRGRPILYSLGNFAIEQPNVFNTEIHLDQSFEDIGRLGTGWNTASRYISPPETRHTMIAELAIDGDTVTTTFRPCRIDDDSVPQVLAEDDPAFAEVVDYVRAVTAEAGLATSFDVEGDRVRVG